MIFFLTTRSNGCLSRAAAVLAALMMLAGCSHLEIQKKARAIQQIQPGQTQTAVFDRVGPPDRRHDITEQRFVGFYETRPGRASDDPFDETRFTPIAFDNGTVVAVGEDLTEQWTREEAARLKQIQIAEQARREAERRQAAQQAAEAERLKKIADLEARVRPIPASNAALNLKLYRQLLELDPVNAEYRDKVAFYEARLARQEAMQRERAERAAREKQRQAWEQSRDARNQFLRQYTGNRIAEIAVHDMGSGSLYVWVKNVGRQMITTHPDHFTLVDSRDQPIASSVSESLDSVLSPGGISHGRIEYDREVQPKALIFQNRESGRVVKPFAHVP